MSKKCLVGPAHRHIVSHSHTKVVCLAVCFPSKTVVDHTAQHGAAYSQRGHFLNFCCLGGSKVFLDRALAIEANFKLASLAAIHAALSGFAVTAHAASKYWLAHHSIGLLLLFERMAGKASGENNRQSVNGPFAVLLLVLYEEQNNLEHVKAEPRVACCVERNAKTGVVGNFVEQGCNGSRG